jgi:hypothetical protein
VEAEIADKKGVVRHFVLFTTNLSRGLTKVDIPRKSRKLEDLNGGGRTLQESLFTIRTPREERAALRRALTI